MSPIASYGIIVGMSRFCGVLYYVEKSNASPQFRALVSERACFGVMTNANGVNAMSAKIYSERSCVDACVTR
jgi:hypothetical protein